jgi:hypothetical protein
MADGMSRKDRIVFQLLMLLAVGTFLFGVWALVGGLRKPAPLPPAQTNSASCRSD